MNKKILCFLGVVLLGMLLTGMARADGDEDKKESPSPNEAILTYCKTLKEKIDSELLNVIETHAENKKKTLDFARQQIAEYAPLLEYIANSFQETFFKSKPVLQYLEDMKAVGNNRDRYHNQTMNRHSELS